MKLHEPVIITPRLLPGLRIGDGTISLDTGGSLISARGRVCFHYFIDLPALTFEARDLESGAFDTPSPKLFQSALCGLLGFLEAAAESYRFRLSLGRLGDNADLFPPLVVRWAYQNSEEIAVARFQLAEVPDLIQEEAA